MTVAELKQKLDDVHDDDMEVMAVRDKVSRFHQFEPQRGGE